MGDGMSSGFGGVLSSVIGGIFGMAGNEQDFQNQKELQEMQNNWNEMMWQKNADWNSPENQMKLMAAAGINPAFAAAGVSGAPAYGAPAASIPMHTPTNLGAVLSQAAGGAPQAIKTLIDAKIGGKISYYYDRTQESNIENIQAQTKEFLSRAGYNDAQTKQILDLLPALTQKTWGELEQIKITTRNIAQHTELLFAEIGKVKSETENVEKQTEKLNAEIENVQVDTQLKQEQINTQEKITENVESQTKLNKQQLQKIAAEAGFIKTQELLAKSQIDINSAEYVKKLKEAIYQDIENQLAGFGIFPNGSLLGSFGGAVGGAFKNITGIADSAEIIQQDIEHQSERYQGKNK